MKQYLKSASFLLAALFLVVGVQAQEEKETKEKMKKGDMEQIIITTTGDKKEKIVVEINGDKVTVNGKDINDLKDEDIQVIKNKFKGARGFTMMNGQGDWNMNWNQGEPFALTTTSSNRAMLGVTTETTDDGVEITNVTEGSAAEKAGLKEGDYILKVDEDKVENPDKLTKLIRAHKPGDKVKITYKRDKKEMTASAELGKFEGVSGVYNLNDWGTQFRELDNLREMELPRVPRVRSFSVPGGESGAYNFSFFDEESRLGLSVQDTEEGKGVKVLEVDEESNAAKAGIQEGDVIVEFAGKEVNSADEVAKLYREKLRAKATTVPVKMKRDGKEKSVEIKVPRKLKTADL